MSTIVTIGAVLLACVVAFGWIVNEWSDLWAEEDDAKWRCGHGGAYPLDPEADAEDNYRDVPWPRTPRDG